MNTWRYLPFEHDGKAVSAIITEADKRAGRRETACANAECATGHAAHFTREVGFFGFDPQYKVEVFGDGHVIYEGKKFVDVEGIHHYHIAPGAITTLVDSLRAKDIWSSRPEYSARLDHVPLYVLTLDIGGQVHQIVDYAGPWAGMPSSIRKFEDEVDEVCEIENVAPSL